MFLGLIRWPKFNENQRATDCFGTFKFGLKKHPKSAVFEWCGTTFWGKNLEGVKRGETTEVIGRTGSGDVRFYICSILNRSFNKIDFWWCFFWTGKRDQYRELGTCVPFDSWQKNVASIVLNNNKLSAIHFLYSKLPFTLVKSVLLPKYMIDIIYDGNMIDDRKIWQDDLW